MQLSSGSRASRAAEASQRGPVVAAQRHALWRRTPRCSPAARGVPGEGEGLLTFDPDSMDPVPIVNAPRGARPIVVLPGFGNCASDYESPFGSPEEGLATQLRERGWTVETLDIERKAWFNVARSLLTLGVWRGTLTTEPGYTWYIQRISDAVRRAQEATGSDTVHLLAHSAGGWLGRAYLGRARGSGAEAPAGDGEGDVAPVAPHPAVASLTTLGTPHRPPARGKAKDMTGGALSWVDRSWPGAAFADGGVRYVAVAGRAVRGCAEAARAKERTLKGYAHASYEQVLGEGDGVWGDCVVPTELASLDGATNVTLDGVRHSMARIGTWDERGDNDHLWYGSPQVIDTWLGHLAAFDTNRPSSSAQQGAGVVLPGEAWTSEPRP